MQYDLGKSFDHEAQPHWDVECMVIPSTPSTLSVLRKRVVKFFSETPLSHEELADFELAFGEACANALRHGSPNGDRDEIRVKCMRNSRLAVIEVSDNGYGFDPDNVPVPIPDSKRVGGMGIYLMKRLVDEVDFEFGSGTTVRLIKYSQNELSEE